MNTRTAFSLGETMMIVLILGACAAFLTPQFAGASEDERTSKAQVVIGGVRDAINLYADRNRERGNDPFPSVAELSSPGIVLMNHLPPNPFTGVRGVQAVTQAQAQTRGVSNTADAGWNYYCDNSAPNPTVIFYANSTTPTTAPGPDGDTLTANEL